MSKLIGIVGKKGSGKSYMAELIQEYWPSKIIKFAHPLKKMLAVLLSDLGYSPETQERMLEGDLKEVIIPELKVTARSAMQTLGTEWGRNCVSPHIWVSAWINQVDIAKMQHQHVICDDIRFDNEFDLAEHMGFDIIQMLSPSENKQVDMHESEQLKHKICDLYVMNDYTKLEVDIYDVLAGSLKNLETRPVVYKGKVYLVQLRDLTDNYEELETTLNKYYTEK